MNLVIDIGNTSIKAALFDDNKMIKHHTFLKLSLKELITFTDDYQVPKTIISSVQKQNQMTEEIVRHFNALYFSHKTAIPISSNYKTPETLGTDRVAAIVGINNEYPNQNALSIDVGSCITYDYFIKESYLGGRISPGLKMRFDALHHFTNQLPELSISDTHFTIGIDTDSSIIAGVQQGALEEIDTIIYNFRKENQDAIVILSGGDYKFFEKHLKNSIFADPFIVLKGLNTILKFNAK
ncbi:MAG: type III pantothenate kinase [Bacteroidota bacterium]|nr:type III pantothenate kinase [Bacteroidota bacterium]